MENNFPPQYLTFYPVKYLGKKKCSKCGQYYKLFSQDEPYLDFKHTVVTHFIIADLSGKLIRHGTAVSHC
jgi:hypothetical protein